MDNHVDFRPEPVVPPAPAPATRHRRRWVERRSLRWGAAVVGVGALAVPVGIATLSPAGATTVAGASSSLTRTTESGFRGRGYGYGYGSGYGSPGSDLPGSGLQTYGGGSTTAPTSPSTGTATTTTATDTSTATAAQSTGLVEVDTTLDYGEGEAAGTGMVIGSDGIVVTNHHVVADATKITVTVVSTGKTYVARLIGADAKHDVAVLKLRGASDLTTITTASAPVAKGADVTAVGDAGGDKGSLTAAPGTVAGLHRAITVSEDTGGTAHLTDLIKVTSDIIPGDSGGALRDSAGDVVGMNVAASEGSADVTGYVIPVARVERIATKILDGDASGPVTLGYAAFLGVELSTAGTGATGTTGGTPVIAEVLTSGAAATAGLAAGDTITSLDGASTPTVAALRKELATLRPGQSVSLSWTAAAGASHTATLTLGRAPVA